MRTRTIVLLSVVALSTLAVVIGPAARAVVLHQETPRACEIQGEICIDENTNSTGTQNNRPVSDPSGKVVRSLVTLVAILIVLGFYFAMAFGGGVPFRRKPRARHP